MTATIDHDVIRLDQEQVNQLEPKESPSSDSASYTTMLSPYAVPIGIQATYYDKAISMIDFLYSGKEESANDVLDDLVKPVVTIAIGIYTKKVQRILFNTPVAISDMDRIEARFRARGKSNTSPASHRLSCLMVAAVLHHWRNELFHE